MQSPLDSVSARRLVAYIQDHMLNLIAHPSVERSPAMEAHTLVDMSRTYMDTLKERKLLKDYAIDSSRLVEDWHMDKRGNVAVTTRELYGELHELRYRRESHVELNRKLSKLRHYGRRKKREAARRYMGTVIVDLSLQPVVPVHAICINMHLTKEFNDVPAPT